jgi:ABC-type branched-subunit amino acid transport system ATPase component/ABC-type branched-subunit amino acid transport system permease subunit
MNDVVLFAILGLAQGALYTLLGLGLIVVYRSSGVVNFAHGGVAMVAGYIYFDLRNHAVPTWSSVSIAAASGAVLGIAIYLLAIRPLARASALTKTVATLAVLAILQSLTTIRYGSNPAIPPSFLPQSKLTLFGTTITADNVIVLGFSIALTLILAYVYRRTSLGLRTTAVSENEFALTLLGRNPTLTAAVNWTIGGLLAGVSGVLFAPLLGLTPASATPLLITGLAVALCGQFSTFGPAMAGAMVIGVIQSELVRYANSGLLASLPGLAEASPFLIMIIVLVARGKGMPSRGFVLGSLPRIGTGHIGLRWGVVVLCGVTLATLLTTGDWLSALTTSFVAAALLLSVVVVSGYAGQLSIAQVSISGVGAVVATLLVVKASWPIPVAALAGVLSALPVALLIGLPALRTRGIMLAVVTFGLADALNAMVYQRPDLNNSGQGFAMPNLEIFGWKVDELEHPRGYALVCLILLCLISFAVSSLRRSSVGKTLIAVRANERASAALGVQATAVKLYAFVVAGGIAAAAGIMAAWRLPIVLFSSGFDPITSINSVVAATLGGIGFISGAIVGGSTMNSGSLGGQIVTEMGLGTWMFVIVGALLLVSIIFNPNGAAINTIEAFRSVVRRVGGERFTRATAARFPRRVPLRSEVTAEAGASTEARIDHVCLEVKDLHVTFGATHAVNGVSLTCEGGLVLGLIGPNGSGKTTLIDAISGFARSSGSVVLDGMPLQTLPAFKRSRAGVSRSFQSLELFEELSVADNLLVAASGHSWIRWVTCLFWPDRPQMTPAAIQAVGDFHLGDVLDESPASLPYGKRRLLGMTRAIATSPRVLLLDEPAAGLGQAERDELRLLIRRLADERGMAVLLVEHDVELVMGVSDRVVALEFGRVIAEGSPADVRRHPEVVRAYLGVDKDLAPSPSNAGPEQ